MKKTLIIALVAIVTFGITALPTRSKVKSYYSGDAVNYHNQVIVGSTNSESLEVFKLEGGELKRFVNIRPLNSRFNTYDSFYDLKFNVENGKLYVYAISGFTIYKYDLSDLNSANLVKKDTNSYWEWYSRIDRFGNDIVTISARGVRVWSNDLVLLDTYDIKNDVPYNIRSNGSDQYIFNVSENEIQVFDRQSRKIVKNIQVNYRVASGNRSLYFDPYDEMIYAVDDYSAKKFDLVSGALSGRFEHSGNPGYDVASSDNEYLYFSNGIGVVKLEKSSMKLLASQTTGAIAGTEGWAMGLKVVANDTGDKVVVFNNASLAVLDSNLKLLGYARAQADYKPEIKENLFLRLNTISSEANSQVLLTGGGFYPNEKITINFADRAKTEIQTDEMGRFKKLVDVPNISKTVKSQAELLASLSGGDEKVVAKEKVDIKVSGESSKLNYSIGFEITD